MATINDNYEQIINEFGNKIEGFDTDIKDIDSKKATNVDLETERARVDKHDLYIKDINDKKATKEELEVERARINDINSQLGQTETKNTEQDSRLDKAEYVNKRQETLMKGLLSENSDGRLSINGEGNHIKLEGSKDGVIEVKKAVGNTLVNLGRMSGVFSKKGVIPVNPTVYLTNGLQVGKIYTRVIFVSKVVLGNVPSIDMYDSLPNADGTYRQYPYKGITNPGVYVNTFTPIDNTINVYTLNPGIDCVNADTGSEIEINGFILLEGDYTNKPIPSESFEGMQSCFEDKLINDASSPNNGKYEAGIKVVGKNKSPGTYYPGGLQSNGAEGPGGTSNITYFNKVKPNTSYVTSIEGVNRSTNIYFYDKDKKFISKSDIPLVNFTTPSNCHYTRHTYGTSKEEILQLEEGTVSTPYEPYKEHIQTLYLDEPLYANNELCVHEGALGYWKNYKKVVFNGSEDWAIYTVMSGTNVITIGFGINFSDIKKIENLNVTHGISCDILPVITQTLMWKTDCEGISISNNQNIRVRVLRTKAQTLSEFKTYLKNNPMSFLYPLEEPIFVPILDETPKWVLECFNECSVYFDTNVPITTSSFTYSGNVPSVYGLEETGVTNTKDIADTQVAVDYLLMNSKDPMSTNLFTRKGMCNMGAYFASRIMKGFLDYGEVIRKYPEFKDDIDFILRSEGREDLIK